MPKLVRVGSTVAAGVIAASFALGSEALSREIHKSVPLSPTGRLEISTFKGSVDVSVWDRPEAEISARIEADGDDSDAARKVERTEVRIESKGGGETVRVESNYDHVRHLFSFFDDGPLPFVRYTIRMPATARLEIRDYKSDSRVTGLKADLDVNTYKGTLRAVGLDGGARVETYKGEIHVAFARYSHASRFRTYKGAVEVRLPKESPFELDASAGRRGEVESDFAVASSHRSHRGGETVRGSVNGGGPELSFESTKGTFRLKGD